MNLNNHSIPGRITTLALILVSSIYAQTLGPSESEVSLQGSRLNYYPRPALAQCQADCANNPNCKGFTWINAGTYQPSDPAMCYLMSAVTGRSPARGHISGVKQVSAGTGGAGTTPTGANIAGSWQWHACNDEFALLIGINMTDGANFTGGFENGNGLIKNGTLRGDRIEFDRDGGSWQQHYSGQLVNDRGQLKIVNGVWTGAYLDRCPGRSNWHAEKR
jgi:PAN domain